MLDFLYLNGWGPFVVTMIFFIPFIIGFVYVIRKRSQVSADSSVTQPQSLSRVETVWIGLVLVLFVGFNLLSLGYMPTIQTAKAMVNEADIQHVDFTAQSWAYDISNRTVEAERPVRFSGRSLDTMHSFAVYDPEGDVRFTLMLMPGLEDLTSIIHTFDKPGTYTIRCLEYCGIAHHVMNDKLTVVQASN
jgi:cytochrome c oxidase subunit 2